MSITLDKIIPNTFQSKQQILDQLIGPKDQYPNLRGWSMFENELEWWGRLMERCNFINDFFINNNSMDTSTNNNSDIKPYLEPILKINHDIGEKELEFICDAWEILINHSDRTSIEQNILFEFSTTNPNRYYPSWVYTNDTKSCPEYYQLFFPILNKWAIHGSLNFLLFFKTFGMLVEFGSSYYPVMFYFKEEYTSNCNSITYTENRLNELIRELNSGIVYEYNLKNRKKTIDQIIIEIHDGNFQIYRDETSRQCMQTMYNAIKDTSGSETWFRTDGDCYSKHPMVQILTSHPDVLKCGHSGMTMSWTFSQFRVIYREGWKKWILMVFLSYGIAWDSVSLEDAIAIKNEDCIIYKIRELKVEMPKLIEFIEFSIENGFNKLCKVILCETCTKSSEKIPLDKIIEWIHQCKNNNALCTILKEYWDDTYHRSIDLSQVDLPKFVQFLYKYLPYEIDTNNESFSVPTIHEINDHLLKNIYDFQNNGLWDPFKKRSDPEKIKEYSKGMITHLNGKYFSLMGNFTKFDPYFIDEKMKYHGFTKKALEKFLNGYEFSSEEISYTNGNKNQ